MTTQNAATSTTWKPLVAGILDIICGIAWVLGVAYLSFIVFIMANVFGASSNDLGQLRLWIPMILALIPGILAIIAGILAIKRRRWLFVLICSGLIAPLVLGIVALILTAMSRKEFLR